VIKEEFRQIAKRIESTYRQEFNDLQFDEWWESFGDEGFDVALRAFKKMKEEYNYFPMVSTFRSYIEGIKEIDESTEKASKKPRVIEFTPEDLKRHERWMRFIFWIQETGEEFPKTSEEVLAMKVKFEKEHPNWRRKKKVPTDKPEAIGRILK